MGLVLLHCTNEILECIKEIDKKKIEQEHLEGILFSLGFCTLIRLIGISKRKHEDLLVLGRNLESVCLERMGYSVILYYGD